MKLWNSKETLFLIRHYENTPCHEIALELQRTKQAVIAKAHTLGLHQNPNLYQRQKQNKTEANTEVFDQWNISRWVTQQIRNYV